MNILKSLVIIMAMAALATGATRAVFTDQHINTNNTFSSGTVDIDTVPATAFINADSLKPGDAVTRPLVVRNLGTMDLAYQVNAIRQAGDADLFNALTLKITNLGGATLYDGSLSGLTPPGMGPRTLSAGANETLGFRVSLPLTAGNELQNKSTTVAFVFSASQLP